MANLISKIKGVDNITYDLQDKVSIFGGTNLLKTTASMPYSTDSWSSWYTPVANTNNSTLAYFHDLLFPSDTKVGDIFLFSFEYEWTKFTAGTGGTFAAPYIQWYANNSWSSGITSPLARTTPAPINQLIAGDGITKCVIKATITNANQITANWYANFRTNYSDGTGKFRIRCFKLERSNYLKKETAWTPAPEDLVTYNGTDTLEFFQ